jgi:hypothetical protein
MIVIGRADNRSQTVDKVVLESALQRHFSLYLDGFLKYSKKMRYTGF